VISRRGILGALIAAPAIVRASSLMPVKQMMENWVPGLPFQAESRLHRFPNVSRVFVVDFDGSLQILAQKRWSQHNGVITMLDTPKGNQFVHVEYEYGALDGS